MKVVERGNTLARIFNLREGFTEKDDWLPPRFFKPKTSGALNETSVNPEDLQKAKVLYYDMMGWTEQGVPKQSKLEELDIAWAADKISVQ
jgi:aldehyde:ferredoxin oxidoreductase